MRRYTLVYYGEHGRIEALAIPFSKAKALAAEAVENGNADRVTIRDDVNRTVYRYPKARQR